MRLLQAGGQLRTRLARRGGIVTSREIRFETWRLCMGEEQVADTLLSRAEDVARAVPAGAAVAA
jgi:hypothetical protein